MKFKKSLSLFIVLGMILTLTPFPTFANAVVIRTMEIAVNAGESISVWNTDIAASGITSNTITVLVGDGTDYDMVFPEGSGTAAMLSHCQDGIDGWNTTDYIKADDNDADGMLVRLNVNSGTALLRIESHGRNLGSEPLTLYTDDGELFAYLSAEKDQTADFCLPQNCNLSNITLMMCAKVGTAIKRITDTAVNGYELYSFAQESLTVSTYSNSNKTGSFAIPYTSAYAKDGEIYYCAKVVVPKGAYEYNVGSMKTVVGSAFYLTPEFAERDETKLTAWDQNALSGGLEAAASYSSLENKLHDTENELITGRNTEQLPISVGGISHSAEHKGNWAKSDAGDNFFAMNPSEDSQSINRRREAEIIHMNPELAGDTNVWYRVHSQTYGWMGWAQDGAYAGSSGLAKRAEAVEVVVSPNGGTPISTYNIYVTGGTADRNIANRGETVNITASVPEGMRFVGWECNADLSFDKSAPTVSVTVSG